MPKGIILCTNQQSTSQIMNRSRVTIWKMLQSGTLSGYKLAGNILIPLADIAYLLKRSETEILNVALAYKLPIWQLYEEHRR